MNEPTMSMWLTEPLTPDVKKAISRLTRLDDVRYIAIMPDVHLAQHVCVGCVIATTRLVYPAAVGGDIGCGIATVALDAGADAVANCDSAQRVLAVLRDRIPVMRHRRLDRAPSWPEELSPGGVSARELATTARREGRIELGTLGRGNHFVELQRDSDNRLWIMVHSGSRIMGQAITHFHLRAAPRAKGGLQCLDTSHESGQAYLHDLAWAIRFAQASRHRMLHAAADAATACFGARADWTTYIDCNHNHVRSEILGNQAFLIHRKGASPAARGERGLIPGCMGGESFHVVGRGEDAALRSSSHGAGRAMSRAEARQRISTRELLRDLAGITFDTSTVYSLREEAPAAYKNIRTVMRAQRELVRIDRAVHGILTYKGL